MRGDESIPDDMFSYIRPEQRVPARPGWRVAAGADQPRGPLERPFPAPRVVVPMRMRWLDGYSPSAIESLRLP